MIIKVNDNGTIKTCNVPDVDDISTVYVGTTAPTGNENIWIDTSGDPDFYPASERTIEVTGTSPTITAEANTRYVCGEVTSLLFTPCAAGLCDVRFTSGSTVTVLTLPSTVKMPDWFDASALDANTIYEINILDGVYGVVTSWAV